MKYKCQDCGKKHPEENMRSVISDCWTYKNTYYIEFTCPKCLKKIEKYLKDTK